MGLRDMSMRRIFHCLGFCVVGLLIVSGLGAQTAGSLKKHTPDVQELEVTSESCAHIPGGCDVYFALPRFGCGGTDLLLRSEKGDFVPVVYYRHGHPDDQSRRIRFSSDNPPRTPGNRLAGRHFIDVPAGWRCAYRWQADAELLKKSLPADKR
jgi:hypothetical protein